MSSQKHVAMIGNLTFDEPGTGERKENGNGTDNKTN